MRTGTLDVRADTGSGYVAVTSGTSWSLGDTVLDACYVGFVGVQVTNPSGDAWTGSIEFSTDGGVTWNALTCANCSETSISTSSIVVDGNGDGGDQANCQCLSGATCTLVVKPAPTSTPTATP